MTAHIAHDDPAAKRTSITFLNWAHAIDHFVLLIYPTVVIGLEVVYGRPYAELMALGTASYFAFGIFALPAGWLGDHWSRRHMIAIFFFGCGLSLAAAAAAPNLIMFAVALFALGVFAAIYHPVGTAMLIEASNARGRTLAFNGVCGNVGAALAAAISAALASWFGWRGAFVACGVPPLVVMLLVALFVRESPIWLQAKKGIEASGGDTTKVPLNELFRGGNARKVSFAALIAFLGMYGYWAVMTWIPSYLATIGFNPKEIPLWTFYILLGAIIGYLTHGAFSDRFGRRTAFSLFFLGAAGASIAFGLLPVYLSRTQGVVVAKTSILLIGPLLSFSTGYFSGYGAYYAELFPTRIRALASGFSFNIGRIGTAIGPGLTGLLAATFGVGGALATASLAFVTCALMIFALPETIGKTLED